MINNILVSFTDHYNAIFLDRVKVKLEKVNGTILMLFYVRPSSPQLQRIRFLY